MMTALHLESLVDSIPKEMHLLSDTNKKRSLSSGHSADGSSVSSGDSSSVSSGDSLAKPVRNKRKKRGKKNKKGSPQPQQPQLTQQEKNQYIAIDCEMVGTGRYGQHSSLARVCMVDWDGITLLDLYVRQRVEVTDYRTFVSGIVEDDLTSDEAVDIEECRARVQELIDDKILVGHALKNDLHVLNISHPWCQVRDTGKYEPFMKIRFEDGVFWPRKLKDLAKEKLGKDVPGDFVSPGPFYMSTSSYDYKDTSAVNIESPVTSAINCEGLKADKCVNAVNIDGHEEGKWIVVRNKKNGSTINYLLETE